MGVSCVKYCRDTSRPFLFPSEHIEARRDVGC
jgi:hypothetical protein